MLQKVLHVYNNANMIQIQKVLQNLLHLLFIDMTKHAWVLRFPLKIQRSEILHKSDPLLTALCIDCHAFMLLL